MLRSRLLLPSILLLSFVYVGTASAVTITGPSFPPDGGTVVFGASGAASAGDAGGRDFNFSSFVQTTGWINLYWGPSSASLPTAGLDNSPHALTLSGFSGTTATWAGTTGWTNPNTSAFNPAVPIELRVDITGLGGAPWSLSTSIAGLDPGPGTGIGAVVDNTSGLNFSANLQFLANTGSGFQSINSVQQASSGDTNSSFGGGFYSVVPEPTTALLVGLGLLALGVRRR